MAASNAHFNAPHQPPMGPLAGAVELVRQISAAGVPLALVTSAGRRYAEKTLTELGVRPLFSVVVTAGDVTVGSWTRRGTGPRPAGWVCSRPRAWCSRTPRLAWPRPRRPGCTRRGGGHHPPPGRTATGADQVVPDLTKITWPPSTT